MLKVFVCVAIAGYVTGFSLILIQDPDMWYRLVGTIGLSVVAGWSVLMGMNWRKR